MAFQKGNRANPNGRPKGAKNKATATLKEALAEIVENNVETLQNDLDEMKPAERARVLLALIEYVLPKAKAAADDDTETVEIIVRHLGPDLDKDLPD